MHRDRDRRRSRVCLRASALRIRIVSLPLLRGHVVMTLNSEMASTKIMSTSGVIGTLTEDRTTAVMGRLGAAPPMIPMEVSITTPQEEKHFHFEVAEVRQLTPVLVAHCHAERDLDEYRVQRRNHAGSKRHNRFKRPSAREN